MITGGESSHSPEVAGPIPVVLHGSFGRHLNEIGAAAEVLNNSGLATVIAPHDCEAIGQQDGFVLLPGEENQDPRDIEASYLEQVLSLKAQGGTSIFVNPEGYVGKSAAYEAGIIQASGGRAFWTEQPQDVPFYVDPASIMPVEVLVTYMRDHSGALPPANKPHDQVSQRWRALPFPVGHIAQGTILRHNDRLLLVEDGRWNGQLTIPGTRVRAGESRSEALYRLTEAKIGVAVTDMAHFATSLMIPGSGYNGAIDPEMFVFDDHITETASDRIHPQNGLNHGWYPLSEVETLATNRQIEPNAAILLRSYLEKAA